MVILNSIEELLVHIKDVQTDAIKLSGESLLMISGFIEKNNLEIDDDVAKALQYQDIISQQLSAIVEAIESVQSSIDRFNHAHKTDESLAVDGIKKLQEKFSMTISDAKDKKNRFSGKSADCSAEQDEIEFF